MPLKVTLNIPLVNERDFSNLHFEEEFRMSCLRDGLWQCFIIFTCAKAQVKRLINRTHN